MNKKFDLIFERSVDIPVEKIWKAWTDPEALKKWFCPRPWKVIDCRIDLKAGGEFYTVMQSPEGHSFPNNGCYLEIIPHQKIVWTNMMTHGYQPTKDDKMGFPFTIILTLTKTNTGTFYKAVVSHADDEGMKKHEQMGFQEGWGLAFNQLVELIK